MSFLNTQAPHPLHRPPDTSVTTASRLRSECRFPAPTLPLVNKWKDMIGTAFSLAIVSYVINLAMGRTLAAKHGYDVDPNQVTLGLEGHSQGPFPLLSGVKGKPRCMNGKLSDVLCLKQTCCSHACRLTWQLAMWGLKGHCRSISHGLERACKREESLRLSSLLCSPSRPEASALSAGTDGIFAGCWSTRRHMYFSLSRERPGFLVCHLATVRGRTLNNPLLSSLAQWQLSITATHTT